MKKIFLTVASEIKKDAKKIKYSLVIGMIISALLCAEPIIKGMMSLMDSMGICALISAWSYIFIVAATERCY